MKFEIAAEDQEIISYEAIGLDFYIDGIRLRDEFLISDNLSEDLIIGASTMQKFRMKLDLEEDKVIVDQKVTKKIIK